MAAQYVFYITQERLVLWRRHEARVSQLQAFESSEAGYSIFENYLIDSGVEGAHILVDVIEEEFSTEFVPKLGLRDRTSLVNRKLRRKYPRTQYKLSVVGGANRRGNNESQVVHSAVTNPELLDPWIRIIQRCKLPLKGIYSVPHFAGMLIARLHQGNSPVLLLSKHQQSKLRQVFLRDGLVKSARLARVPDSEHSSYAEFVVTESMRSRRYLERTRMLEGMEPLEVCLIANTKVADDVRRFAADNSALNFYFVEPETAARKVGLRSSCDEHSLESIYVALSCKKRSTSNYAVSGETRYAKMSYMRKTAISTAVAITIVCSVMAGLNFGKAWTLRKHTEAIESQVVQMSEIFRKENAQFEPIKATSHEMKIAVDTGDYILRNRLPVPWVMQQMGMVLADYPDIELEEISWQIETPPQPEPDRRQRGDQPLPVVIPEIVAVNANIAANIRNYDGNLRDAFHRIDTFAADFLEKTAFNRLIAVDHPVNASPQAAISGEIAADGAPEVAKFRLQIAFVVNELRASSAEVQGHDI